MLKVKFVDCESVTFYRKLVLEILERHFPGQVQEVDDPDFLFCSVFGHAHLQYDCVRILYTGENLVPDFNICDYAIGFHYITFDDRYLRAPLYFFYDEYEPALHKHEISDAEIARKKKFCNFVYSNSIGAKQREEFFRVLSNYKPVDSGGRWMNNVGGPVENKLEFQKDYRFSIAFENSSSLGYTTEKIVQAFAAQTIPIYWGDPRIGEEFNEKSFINCHAYPSFDAVVEEVKRIDADGSLFESYLREPIRLDQTRDARQDFEAFIVRICSQNPEEAIRRNNLHWGARYQAQQKVLAYWAETNRTKRAMNKLKRMLPKKKKGNNG